MFCDNLLQLCNCNLLLESFVITCSEFVIIKTSIYYKIELDNKYKKSALNKRRIYSDVNHLIFYNGNGNGIRWSLFKTLLDRMTFTIIV